MDNAENNQATIIEHIRELRSRIIKSIIFLFVSFIFCSLFATDIFNFLLDPYEKVVGDINKLELIYTEPLGYFFVWLKLSFFGAIFIAFPFIAAQLYLFIAPGLYENEKKAFFPFLIATPVLFIFGAALVYFVAMPLTMKFALSFQQLGEVDRATVKLVAKIDEYLKLITSLIIGVGLCFQLPVLLTLMAKAGLINSKGLKAKRRHAIVGIFLVAAILTPPDPFSQIGLAVPTLLLYELSIISVTMVEKRRNRQQI